MRWNWIYLTFLITLVSFAPFDKADAQTYEGRSCGATDDVESSAFRGGARLTSGVTAVSNCSGAVGSFFNLTPNSIASATASDEITLASHLDTSLSTACLRPDGAVQYDCGAVMFLGSQLTVLSAGGLQVRRVGSDTELFTPGQVSTTIIFTDGTNTYSLPFETSGTQINAFTISLVAPSNPQQIAKRIISNFMSRRADQITSNEPDLSSRLGKSNSGSNGPVTFTGQGTLDNNRLAFATSMRQIVRSNEVRKDQRRRELGQVMALGALGANHAGRAAAPTSGFDIWVKGTWSSVEANTADTDFGMLFVGADYRFGSNLVVGLATQFDWSDEKDNTNNFKIDGRGWMTGPYVVARLHDNLVFDGRAAWGRSDNEVSPFNAYTDSFDGERWLVKGQFTGDYRFGSIHVAPHAGVIYFEEKQKTYTDSNGLAIGSQTVKLGRVTFGPKISTSYKTRDGTSIAPFASIKGIWDFTRTDQVNVATGLAATGNDKLRGRTEAGLSVQLPDGISFSGKGFYDGLGANDYDAYGGSVSVRVPF